MNDIDRRAFFSDGQKNKMVAYLDAHDYLTIYDWARDSGYYLHNGGFWMDENGSLVDIFIQLWYAIEACEFSEPETHFEIKYVSPDEYLVYMPTTDGGSTKVYSGILERCCLFIANIDNSETWETN